MKGVNHLFLSAGLPGLILWVANVPAAASHIWLVNDGILLNVSVGIVDAESSVSRFEICIFRNGWFHVRE